MLENICFESERLKTSKLSNEDALPLFQIYSDAEAMKYRGSKPMQTIDDAYNMISERFIVSDQNIKLRLAIRNKLDDKLLGTLLLSCKESPNKYKIGFSFGKEFWGKGYGQEMLKMVEDKLKSENNAEEIRAWCIKENRASVRIFKKAGYTEAKQSKYPQSSLFVKSMISEQ